MSVGPTAGLGSTPADHLRQLLHAIESAPLGIAFFDNEMRYIAVSRQFEQDLQLTGEPLVGRSHYELFPNLPERWIDVHRRVLAGEECAADRDPLDVGGQREWCRWQMRPWRTADGKIGGAVMFVELVTRQVEEEQRLQMRTAELETLLANAPVGLGFFDRDYRYLRINDELARINGVPAEAHIGRTIREVLSANAPLVEPIIDKIFATGEAVRDLEVSGETPQQPGVTRHWLSGFYPVKTDDGAVEAVGAWVVEISERKAAEHREFLLAREVDHRAKNLLAVVQSVVQLTRADTAEGLKDAVIGRIQSLARAHALLSDSRWEGVDLAQLVREELAPFRGRQARYDGPAISLRPAAAQSLALVLHELATNAAKYGALSSAGGRLDVSWRAEETPASLVLEWNESGAHTSGPPQRSGFGSRIIQTTLERQLRGRLDQDWRPDGLRCRLEIPLAVATASPAR